MKDLDTKSLTNQDFIKINHFFKKRACHNWVRFRLLANFWNCKTYRRLTRSWRALAITMIPLSPEYLRKINYNYRLYPYPLKVFHISLVHLISALDLDLHHLKTDLHSPVLLFILGNFVYHYWQFTQIYHSLSYPWMWIFSSSERWVVFFFTTHLNESSIFLGKLRG